MEYKLCKDNMVCCDDDCRRCANLVYEAMTSENKKLKDENKEVIDKFQALEKQLEWANEDIESLSNKHFDDGFQIMSKDRKIMELEEKCEKLEKENAELVMENNKLHTINSELFYKNKLLMKEKDGFINEIERITEERNRIHNELEALIDTCQEIEKLRDDNQRFAHECRYYIERESELEKENNELRMMNDKLRTMNSELLYRNGLLMKTTGPAFFRPSYSYNELGDEIESLKEDIIRLDKCLSNRQCVQLERIKEEHDGE